VLDALDAARKLYIPILSESENQLRLALVGPAYTSKGVLGASYGSPPWQGAAALSMAIESLEIGKKLEQTIDVATHSSSRIRSRPVRTERSTT
jgi:hypothetical protein